MIASIFLLNVIAAVAVANEGQDLEFCDLTGMLRLPEPLVSGGPNRQDQGPPVAPDQEQASKNLPDNGRSDTGKPEREIQKTGQNGETDSVVREKRGRGKKFPLPNSRERRPSVGDQLGGKDSRVLVHGDDGRRGGGKGSGIKGGGVRGGNGRSGGGARGGKKGGKRENTASKRIDADKPALAQGGFASGRKKN